MSRKRGGKPDSLVSSTPRLSRTPKTRLGKSETLQAITPGALGWDGHGRTDQRPSPRSAGGGATWPRSVPFWQERMGYQEPSVNLRKPL
jgi:hypothetical protein